MRLASIILLCCASLWGQIKSGVVAEEKGLPILGGALFTYTFAEQTGFTTSNTANPSTSANTFTPTIRTFQMINTWWVVTAGTNTTTDNFAAGPLNSNVTASRWQCGGSACSLRSPVTGINTYSIPSGNTTISAYMKLNTGTSATITPEFIGSGATTSWSVTNTWTRFTFTNNNGVATTAIQIFLPAGADLLVYGIQVESASSASSYVTPTLNLFFGGGKGSTTDSPTWSGNGTLTFTNKQLATGFNDTDTTLTTGTYYVALKSSTSTPQVYGEAGTIQNAAGTGVPARFELQTSFWNSPASSPLPDGGSLANNPFVGFGGLSKQFPNGNLYDQQWHICAVTMDGSDVHLYIDGILEDSPVTSPVSGTPMTVPGNMFALGSTSGGAFNGFPGSYAYSSFYANTVHTYSQIRQNTIAIGVMMRKNGLTVVGMENGLLAFEGDSITDGIGTGNVSHAFRTGLHYGRTWVNYGHSGDQIAQLTSRAAQLDALIDRGKAFNILVVNIGRNDLDHITAPSFEANLQTYLQARVAAGWTVIATTVLPTTDSTAQAQIPAVNAWIVANAVSIGCAAVADFGDDPTILANYTSATYLYDGTHPTALTYTIMTPYVTNAIDSLHLGV